MRIRVVVANQGGAAFYELASCRSSPKFTTRLIDRLAHMHDRDFKSDRPGRVYDHAAPTGGRRGAVAHHGTGGERRPRKHEADLFARRVTEELERAQRKGEFDRLVLVAAPAFLGLLRKAMSGALRSCVTAEVGKDLMHETPAVVGAHVPPEVFRELPVSIRSP